MRETVSGLLVLYLGSQDHAHAQRFAGRTLEAQHVVFLTAWTLRPCGGDTPPDRKGRWHGCVWRAPRRPPRPFSHSGTFCRRFRGPVQLDVSHVNPTVEAGAFNPTRGRFLARLSSVLRPLPRLPAFASSLASSSPQERGQCLGSLTVSLSVSSLPVLLPRCYLFHRG